MNLHGVISDQSYMWSVANDRTYRLRSQTTPQAIAAQAAATGRRPSGLLDRTLQALWQSKLQVCRWARTWAQVLPVGELLGQVAADGLRSPGRARAGQQVPGQLRPGSRHLGGDLRDQSRATASARTALRCRGEFDNFVAHRSDRSCSRRGAACQHARQHDRRQPDAYFQRGGQR